MHGMLFGLETELGFSFQHEEVRTELSEVELLAELFSLAPERSPSLPGPHHPRDLFLANGSRLYLDGGHPELCTPECESPADVVRWQLAGERLLVNLAAELEKRHAGVSARLFRSNVDYGGTKATWGCHESYQYRDTTAKNMAAQLIPHLVTRLVYTGAGGFDNRTEHLQFLLSPRVPHLVQEIGQSLGSERGIYHLKNEPLSSGGFRRLHLMCGESLCSQLSNYLKIGTTALVVRLIDAGLCPGEGLVFRSALEAMRTFASDPHCRALVDLADGRRMSAIEVQAAYLARVEEHLSADFMPDWAANVCRRWRRVLDQLATDPALLTTSLDWVIKRALFDDYVKRANATWGGLRRAVGVGAQLCEIDTRFGELGERGLFSVLDRAAAIEHRVPELGSVAEAMSRPPPGRAATRGRAIARLAGQPERYQCNWGWIHDRERPRDLDLRDPFVTSPRWRKRKEPSVSEPPAEDIPCLIDAEIREGIRLYDRMLCGEALNVLNAARCCAAAFGDREREALACFWMASTHQDRAELDVAEEVLAPALELEGVSPELRYRVWTRCALIRIERMAARGPIDEAVENARRAQASGGGGPSRLSFLEARLLGAYGQYPAAIATMERAIGEAATDSIHFDLGSHWHWLIGFALEAGELERARSAIERLRQFGPRYYGGIRLSCNEAELARREGDPLRSFRQSALAEELSKQLVRHRCRLEACLVFVESAVAADKAERAERILEEIQRDWRDVQVGDLRKAVERIERCFGSAPAQQGRV